MYNNIRELNVDDIEIKVFSKNPNEDQIDNIEGSINNAYLSFHAAFCNNQECGGAQKINIYAANTEGEYKELLSEKGIDSSIKSHKFSALKDHSNGEFDIYFYLNRSGDFAYSTLERAVARVLIEGNDVFKSALSQALKTGMVDYVAGLDEIGNVQDNNEDCRDFNKIIKKNLSPYDILKDKKNEAQAEQVIKYLKQENSEKIDTLFKELTNTQGSQNGEAIIENFLNELKDDDLNAKFSEWISKQLEQFQQKLAEKFVPKMESKIMADDTEVTVRYHQDSKMKDVDESVADTLKNFKDAFCSDGECNIPQKLNIFSFNSETDYSQYLCGNNKKSDKLFISNDKDGETSIYLYLKGKSDSKENNNIDILKARVIEAIMKNNGWDHLPQQIKEGMTSYIVNFNDADHKYNNLEQAKMFIMSRHSIMHEFNQEGRLPEEVVEFLMAKKSDDLHGLLKSFKGKSEAEIKKIVSSFMGKLDSYEQEFSDWVNGQLKSINNGKLEEELNPLMQIQEEDSTSMDQIQGQSTEGKQDFIDQVMNSSCITDLGIKPECKDKLEDLIKALKECNEESEDKTPPIDEETEEKPEGGTGEKPPIDEETEEKPEGGTGEKPGEGGIKEPKESISDIFNNFRKTLCSSQECHGAQKVNIGTISGDEFRDLTKNESHYNKSGHFVASNNGDTVDIKLYVDYEKDHSVLDLGSGTFINPHCNSYVPSDLNIGHEYESNCAKAAQVMSFLIQRHPDHLIYLFEDLARSGCNNGDQIMQELDNYYNSELQMWLESNPIV
ncbi:MAG: hypothetical protein sL5_05930 [Candidatus Mesenet longicola]|uniref:Uncharacterized protein n=1 Tax=Candidatus Mesenet longicola TaxID=1892558 RepID=A0A8J3MP66_9RICK|nr:MAG: hypothetical protein sGL2_06250 [Candidatus Mesenet longicola]GHM59600.1 MAG: hypothetical protein sL5_05930 [Candidatus Mesenet longicola]